MIGSENTRSRRWTERARSLARGLVPPRPRAIGTTQRIQEERDAVTVRNHDYSSNQTQLETNAPWAARHWRSPTSGSGCRCLPTISITSPAPDGVGDQSSSHCMVGGQGGTRFQRTDLSMARMVSSEFAHAILQCLPYRLHASRQCSAWTFPSNRCRIAYLDYLPLSVLQLGRSFVSLFLSLRTIDLRYRPQRISTLAIISKELDPSSRRLAHTVGSVERFASGRLAILPGSSGPGISLLCSRRPIGRRCCVEGKRFLGRAAILDSRARTTAFAIGNGWTKLPFAADAPVL